MKTKVKLGLKSLNVPELIAYSSHAVAKMTGNVFFPTPTPTLAKVTTATTNLSNAYNAALRGGPPQTAAMNQARELLELLLTPLGAYVEAVANDPANATPGAETIILSSGFEVKNVSTRSKQVFSLEHGSLSGVIVLLAAGISFGIHEWQYYEDGTAMVWINLPSTSKATTTVSNLIVGKRYYVRHRSVGRDGANDWEEPLSIVVI